MKVWHERRIVMLAALVLPGVGVAAGHAKPAKRIERVWFERSAALADAARRNVSVADFRRDIGAHRETLREIVRANRSPPADILTLQRSMILMNALLNAAAECHSGGRVVCPPDLLHRIDEQLREGFAQLEAIDRAALRGKGPK